MSKIDSDNEQALKNAFSGLYNYNVQPPVDCYQNILKKIADTDSLNTLKQLKHHEVAAPISFQRLMEIIRGLNISNTTKQVGKVVLFSNYKKRAAAAAVLILAVSTFLFLNKSKNNDEALASNINVASTNNNNNSNQNDIIGKTGTSSITPNLNELKNKKLLNNEVAIASNKSKKSKGQINRKYANSFAKQKQTVLPQVLIDGASYSFIDNDYLATFASFDSSNLPEFLKVENPFIKSITVDKYSYFEISEGMGAMMKKMYSTKINGSPTRRARKQRAKIEKWKIADSIYFKQNSNLNPLDPRDLSNFILNK